MFKQSMEFPIAAVSCSSISVYVQPGLFIACWGIPIPVVTWSMVESTPDNRRQITTTGFKWRHVCQVLYTDPN